jgi:thiosulfate dehydrogenase (quinone)
MTAVAMEITPVHPAAAAIGERNWRTAAIAMLAVRITLGFIYWGGGSRRFIYAPDKLNPDAHSWMANKFQSAMPGALFGADQVISFLLLHFDLLYAGLILFSAAELLSGVMLMAGFLTRLAALASMSFSVLLMITFGWQGGTCVDEWTMAAATLAMGGTLFLAGSGAYSIDNLLLRRDNWLATHPWFRWMGGSLPLPLTNRGFRFLGLALLAVILAFTIGTYDYFRGSVVTAYHGGPVSPTRYHFTLSNAVLTPQAIRFHAYLDAGSSDNPAHILEAELLAPGGSVLEHWDMQALSRLPAEALRNTYAYNKFATGPYGLTAGMGAKAVIELPTSHPLPAKSGMILRLTTVDGDSFTAPVTPAA